MTMMKMRPLPPEPIVHKLSTAQERDWQSKACAIANSQDESDMGEMIEYWLPPLTRENFDGEDITPDDEDAADGPYCLSDPRLNHGTLTDEEVFEYCRITHGTPPLMIIREKWGEAEVEGEE